MFNSNDFLLLKSMESDINDNTVPLNNTMNDSNNNNKDYKKFIRTVESLNFVTDESLDVYFNDIKSDKRMQSIKAIMITESTYLKRIRELLTEILDFFNKNVSKFGKRQLMNQVCELLDKFPEINNLHLSLHQQLKDIIQSTTIEVGNVLFQFLSQSALLDVYTNYVAKFSNTVEICKNLKARGYFNKHAALMSLEAIVTSPIQRFPQLSMAIGDIFKYTPEKHNDRIPLFRAMAIAKSITARLDKKRREFEYSDFTEMEIQLQRLKLPFSSKQLLVNNSVFDVRSNFQIPRRIVKIPYYLILCDNNVVMLPRDVPLSELTEKNAFSYSLKDVECKQKVLSNFLDSSNNCTDLEEARNLYGLVNDSFSNDVIVKDYESLLNDYRILMKLNEDLHFLNFRYRGIDTLKLSKSLIELELQLKSKEIELNLQLGSILTLTIKASAGTEFKKIFLFDSIRQSNEWRMNFSRAKLLSTTDMTVSWKCQSFSKKIPPIRATELPVLFYPFVLRDNGIIEIPAGIVKVHPVSLVVGWKIYRCLWVCLVNGWVVILHFDYKQWMVLESFKMEKSQSVIAICVSATSNIDSPDHPYDSEIWMSCGESIFIHSLLENQRSVVRKRLDLPSEVRCLCNVDNKMLVALKSKKVLIYSRNRISFWLQEGELKRCQESFSEELREIFYGHNSVYSLFKTKIIIYRIIDFSPIKVFKSDREITTFFVTQDGVWITVCNSSQLILYDKMFDCILQTVFIPLVFSRSFDIGKITSTYISDRYTWIGTEKGQIICIATIDRLYCTDSNIPMYMSLMSSVGPVTQLLPFQNIHGVNIRYTPEEYVSKKDKFDQRIPLFRRTISNPPLADGYQRLSYSCQNINKLTNGSKEEDSSSNSSLQSAIENLKNTTPTLVLAIGSGLAKYTEVTESSEKSLTREDGHIGQSTLFTFLE